MDFLFISCIFHFFLHVFLHIYSSIITIVNVNTAVFFFFNSSPFWRIAFLLYFFFLKYDANPNCEREKEREREERREKKRAHRYQRKPHFECGHSIKLEEHRRVGARERSYMGCRDMTSHDSYVYGWASNTVCNYVHLCAWSMDFKDLINCCKGN